MDTLEKIIEKKGSDTAIEVLKYTIGSHKKGKDCDGIVRAKESISF